MKELKKTIFVTGASGFLGMHFISDTINCNFKIFALTRNKKNIELSTDFSHIEVLEGDINEIEKFKPQLVQCDYFIHIAGEKRDETKMEDVNVNSMKKILSALCIIPAIKIIYISSSGVYGIENYPSNNLSEDDKCYPGTVYEKSKLAAENYLINFSKEKLLNYIILRPSNVFGENDKSFKLLGLMRSLKSGLFFYLKRDVIVNYVYVKYVTAVIIYFIGNDRINNEIYNVNSKLKLEEFIEVLKSELNVIKSSVRIPYWLFYPFTFFFDLLPLQYQLFNSEKYFALTNRKSYSIEKLKLEYSADENELIIQGLKNLVSSYKEKRMI